MSENKWACCFTEVSAEIMKVAGDCGYTNKVSDILSYKDRILSEKKCIVVAGGNNAGKSSLVNLILSRNLLHISAAATMDKKIAIDAAKYDEQVVCNGKSTVEFDEFKTKRKQYFEEYDSFEFRIKNDWLETSGMKLIEASSQDFARKNGIGLPDIIRDADYMLYVVSALMPLTKADIETITLCVLNGIPCRVFLSKLDLIETKEEQEEVFEYVRNQLDALFEDIRVVPVNLAAVGLENSYKFTESVREWIDGVDIGESRDERLYLLMVEAINSIHSYAEIMRKNAERKCEDKANSIRMKKDELAMQRVHWSRLEQEIVGRRLDLRDMIEKNIKQNSMSVCNYMIEDMEKSWDLDAWWDKVMPGLMRDKMLDLSSQMSKDIIARMGDDQEWLVSEVNRLFNLHIDIVRKTPDLSDSIVLKDNDIALKKPGKWLVVSGVGMVVAVASVFTLSPMGIFTGAAASLAGFGMGRAERKQNKEVLKNEVMKYVSQYSNLYVDEIDKQLKRTYDNMIKELREYSVKWQNEQMDLIEGQQASSADEKPLHWDAVMKSCDDILMKTY